MLSKTDLAKKLGRKGERWARRLLQRAGYRHLASNYATTRGELDLIMQAADTVVFVEVKTRRNEDIAPVEAAVTAAKQRRMTAAAKQFIQKRGLHDCPCRFDVVTVLMDERNKPQLTHYPNAFAPWR